jgi:glycosyltransferase involved in cell wall biosynthesis
MQARLEAPAPRVSVIVPVFNGAADVPVALRSVFGQTFSSFEVIVINDGSDDEPALLRVLDPYASQICYITQPNQGAGAARNAGIRVARGEYVALLDADDRWLPDFLQRQIAFLDAQSHYALVYSDALISGESVLAGQCFSKQAPSNGPVTLISLIKQTCNIPLSTVVARRATLASAGLFDTSLRRGQDFDLWLRLAARGERIAYQRLILVERRVRRTGLSGDAEAELQRAITVLDRFGTSHILDHEARTALRQRSDVLRDRLAIEEAKRRICEANFAAARSRLTEAQSRGFKIWVALLGLRVAPQLVRLAYLSSRPQIASGVR